MSASSASKEQTARELFDLMVDNYQARVQAIVHNTSSLVFKRREHETVALIDRCNGAHTVLDFGMGPAVYLDACLSRGMSYHGIDYSAEMVDLARRSGRSNCSFDLGDASSLDAHASKFDLVLCIGVIDYLEDPYGDMRQLAACVRPGGHLILAFRNKHAVPRYLREAAKRAAGRLTFIKRLKPNSAFSSGCHENAFSWNHDMKPFLRSHGFEPLEIRYYGCSPIFFTLPLPKPIWTACYHVDAHVSSEWSRGICSGAVFLARRCLP